MPTDPTNRDLSIALNAADGVSRAAACRLAASPELWAGGRPPRPALAVELGVPVEQLRRALELLPRAATLAARETRNAAELGAEILTRTDPRYPQALLDLTLPPPVLYCQGCLRAGPAAAIVGSRRGDAYGREVADLFARTLAHAGVTVVSGFARGIDAAAHRGALEAGGPTVAVLGCGLGVDYPRGHERLRREISEKGALLTELRCRTPPRAWHFPVRNRVIAALAGATLVVQAAARSGSLITARHALELGRDVYAVPGRIFDELSLGPHALIRDGALPTQHPRDLLDNLLPLAPGPLFSPMNPEEPPAGDRGDAREPPPGAAAELLAALPRGEQRGAEELGATLSWPVDQVLGRLLELELGGWVRRLPGPAYRRCG